MHTTHTPRPADRSPAVAQTAPGASPVPAAAAEPPADVRTPTAPLAPPPIGAPPPLLLRLPAVVRACGLSRSTIYKLVSQKSFPAPVRLTGRAVGWRQAEVDGWVASRVRAH